jgi:surface polysaccharide O-acyltransferase-like enzyme
MQVVKSIQNQSVPFLFFISGYLVLGPGWMQATGQASTQSATPSQVLVTIECGTASLSEKENRQNLANSVMSKPLAF